MDVFSDLTKTFTLAIWWTLFKGDLSNLALLWPCSGSSNLYHIWWWWLLPRLQGFQENVNHSFPACALKKTQHYVEISLHTLLPLLMPRLVHSGSVSWDDFGRMFPDKLCVSISLYVLTLCLDSSIVSPLRLHWVKGVCIYRCNLPSALLAEWPGSFICHCGKTGVEQTQSKSAHKVNSKEENS